MISMAAHRGFPGDLARERKAKRVWEAYCHSGKKPVDIPARPDIVYRKQWRGWVDWLGWDTSHKRLPESE